MMYGLIIFFLVLGVDLLTDVRLFYKKRHVNHVRGAMLRCIFLAPAIYFLGWLAMPAMFFLYLILFNGIYNKLIGQKWEFVGTTAALDRMQHKIPKWGKYVLLIISILLYVRFRN